ncbi:methyltransferase domain-containing protein [Croceicoccus bisphenolivorans]|uniref:methyltransferase domain-containing protein n=1 Tax=Croceicoccus bisphenolivorans TaxID=1783232 RepID=UPI00083585E0|nr:methyltransferase domain-containing protein [Croceicoccus bisphenolivorans]
MRLLAERARREEQMDDPAIAPEIYAHVLADLARVNRWTLTARPTLRFLKQATRGLSRFSLLDVGFGHGDMLRSIARWAHRRAIACDLVGVDLNPLSAAVAREASAGQPEIDFRTGDYRLQPERFDFIISSQVGHHMTSDQLRAFLQFMESQALRGWLLSDLDRHVISYLGFPLLARLMRVHRIVREDGTLSIARSIRASEWPAILTDAGIDLGVVRVQRHMPFRISVERHFPPTSDLARQGWGENVRRFE